MEMLGDIFVWISWLLGCFIMGLFWNVLHFFYLLYKKKKREKQSIGITTFEIPGQKGNFKGVSF